MKFIDTHIHIDGEEFKEDLELVIQRARESGAEKLLVPGINWESVESVAAVVNKCPGYCYGMIGLHPEDVKSDYKSVIERMKDFLKCKGEGIKSNVECEVAESNQYFRPIAIGEVGLDYYWSREFETEQLDAFELQVQWAQEENLPLMIHCRKAQNEMVKILRRYEGLTGVFHCFTGNELEAQELLAFDGFYLGIGGVSTFKKSKLPDTLSAVVPLSRIVLETDAPYMAPVPHRGERNESSFIPHIIEKLAAAYGVSPEEVAEVTTRNAKQLFGL